MASRPTDKVKSDKRNKSNWTPYYIHMCVYVCLPSILLWLRFLVQLHICLFLSNPNIERAIRWQLQFPFVKWKTVDMMIISCSRFILMLAQFGFIAFHTYQGDSHVESEHISLNAPPNNTLAWFTVCLHHLLVPLLSRLPLLSWRINEVVWSLFAWPTLYIKEKNTYRRCAM